MKILYIITQADGGGAQQYVLTLAKHFGGTIAAGNEAQELFISAQNLQLTAYELKHLKRSINPWHDFWAIFEIKSLVKKLQPDIVHLNSTKAGFLGSIGAKLAGTKTVFTAHGFRFLEPMSQVSKAFYLAIEKLAGWFRDYIITVSNVDKTSALKYNLINPKKISTIHNGIPPIPFLAKDEARTQLNLPQNVLVLATVANFYKTKGLDVLIDAVSLLPKEIKDKCIFVIFGDGAERRNLELKIRNYGLGQTILLKGKVNEPRLYLKAFDIFVLPSRKEGFPFAILEAMQAGLPIVATKVGGIPEAVNDAGILVEPENPAALATAITTSIRRRIEVPDLDQASLARSKFFTEQKMLEETKKVYENLIK